MPLNDTAEPFPAVARWLRDAETLGRRNPLATALSTVGEDGRPAVRMVLLKSIDVARGYIVFYTNYHSRKARELAASPWASAVLYWEELGRQLRFEGRVVRSPEAESDAYFSSRPPRSQLNAWVSAQSRELEPGTDLEQQASLKARELWPPHGAPAPSASTPRPPFWGGYRLWCDRVELWSEGEGRFHDRLQFSRSLSFTDAGADPACGAWRRVRLQP